MKIVFKNLSLIVLAGCAAWFSGCALIGNSVRAVARSNSAAAPSPTPTPQREYNEKRLPVMYNKWWHRSKAGLIVRSGSYSTDPLLYIAQPGAKPVLFKEYPMPEPNYPRDLSHDGKYSAQTNKYNERVKSSGCCAIQEFDYETVLVETAAPANKIRLADENWQLQGWSPDDKHILFSDLKQTLVVNVESREKTVIYPGTVVREFAFAKNGGGLFAFSPDKKLEYFDFATKRLALIFAASDLTVAWSLSPDEKIVALIEKAEFSEANKASTRRLRVIDVANSQQNAVFDLPAGKMNDLQWRADNQEILFETVDENYSQNVYSINARSGKISHWYPPAGETTGLYKTE